MLVYLVGEEWGDFDNKKDSCEECWDKIGFHAAF